MIALSGTHNKNAQFLQVNGNNLSVFDLSAV